MTRVLLTGASSLLGRAILKQLKNDSSLSDVLGLAFSRTAGGLRKVDLSNSEELQCVIDDFKPDFVVHSAAERRPDKVDGDREGTHNLNVSATSNICKMAANIGAPVLYISTDYVFDGDNAPYKTDAAPNPLNYYGQTKLEGEKEVLRTSSGNLVLRVPILYGEVEFVDESAVTTIFKCVKDSTKATAQDHYARRYPTHCEDVANVILQMIKKKIQDVDFCGIYHWSGSECFTKFEMAIAMATVFGLPHSHITPVTTPPPAGVKRPYDAHLDCEKLEKIGITANTPFNDGIKACLLNYL